MIYFGLRELGNLQEYIPIIHELNNRKYKSSIIICRNKKKFACPYLQSNLRKIYKCLIEYDINIIEDYKLDFSQIEGIVFVANGDMVGEPKYWGSGNLKKIDRSKVVIFSLMQRLDWIERYNLFIDDIDYCIFEGEDFYKQFNLNSNKKLSLGLPKYDDVIDAEDVYKKFQIQANKKYCLILLPNRLTNFHPNDFYFSEYDLLNIYSHLRQCGYGIITKTRPKTTLLYGDIEEKFKGNYHIVSDCYPNETLELLQISDLCLTFSSTAIDESYRMKVPTIDLKIRPYQGNDFFLNDKSYVRIENWRDITFENFNFILSGLQENFDIEKYFPIENSSVRCVDYLQNNYLEEMNCNGIGINDMQSIKIKVLGL